MVICVYNRHYDYNYDWHYVYSAKHNALVVRQIAPGSTPTVAEADIFAYLALQHRWRSGAGIGEGGCHPIPLACSRGLFTYFWHPFADECGTAENVRWHGLARRRDFLAAARSASTISSVRPAVLVLRSMRSMRSIRPMSGSSPGRGCGLRLTKRSTSSRRQVMERGGGLGLHLELDADCVRHDGCPLRVERSGVSSRYGAYKIYPHIGYYGNGGGACDPPTAQFKKHAPNPEP